MSKENRRLYNEITKAVRQGKAHDFYRCTKYKYPDAFFTVGKLRVILTNVIRVHVSTDVRVNDAERDYSTKIRGGSFRLRRALAKANPKEHRQYIKGIKPPEEDKFLKLLNTEEVTDA